ncbi:sigma-54-dependent Fis family transcriptional regulator [Alteribacillus sp. YIM 98480]|uniref:sigma-54-dependent Fis family transcriptional regulator n=1 Tax=Alteribacillus sp. YIM 98480 TaxID=2606599 RepID=UPI00131AA0D1|nr:sigma 54-interacting transcriptional regulator [Alteribacillus sp. YIM 98480]
MRNIIESSWERCEASGLSRTNEELEKQVSNPQFTELKETNAEFLNVASPIISDLHEIVYGTGFLTLLTTEDGVVLKVLSDPSTQNFTENYQLKPGRVWREEWIGKSAIGLVVHHGKPCQVVGEEHYWVRLHGMTCSAAPIKNEKGKMLGIVNVSGPVERVHVHTLGMVVSAAKAIERQYQLNQSTFETKQMNQTLNTLLNVVEDGVILVDQSQKVVQANEFARLVLKKEHSLKGKPIKSLFSHPKLHEAISTLKPLQNEIMTINPINRSALVQVKPVVTNENRVTIVITFREVQQIRKMARRITGNEAYKSMSELKGKSKSMERLREKVGRIAKSEATVLILGETGSGKEIVAHSIHNMSDRRDGPFVVVNCAALPRNLLESELFGYEGGTFTGGWKEGKPGKFELANGGTIFLDEIGEMTLDMQVILLRVLQEQMVTRLGGSIAKPVDIRIISATNKNLKAAIQIGEFREDLYYRLNLLRVTIPPLRERIEDIPELVQWFTAKHQKETETKTFHPKAVQFLKDQTWPGNVRELENVIQRSLIMSESQEIQKHELQEILGEDADQDHKYSMNWMSDIQEQKFLDTYEKTHGNVTETARQLGISRATAYRWKKKYGK